MFLRVFIYVVTGLAVAALGYTAWDYLSFQEQRNARIDRIVTETTDQLTRQIDERMRQVMQESTRLAERLETGDYTPEQLASLLRQSSLAVDEVQGVTAAYQPYAFDDDVKLYAPYYSKGTQQVQQLEDSYDYTSDRNESAAWYTQARDRGPGWIEPYYGEGTDTWNVDYSVPFQYAKGPQQGKFRGVVTATFVCRGLSDLIHQISLGKTGFGIVISTNGTFLSHPVRDYIGKRNIRDEIASSGTDPLKNAFQAVLEQEQGQIRFADPERGDWRRISFRVIDSTGWKIALVFFESDLVRDRKSLDRRRIHLALFVSLVIIALLASYFNRNSLDEREIWQLSAAASLLLLANICLIGLIRHQSQRLVNERGQLPVTDLSALAIFERQQLELAEQAGAPPPTSVPTGLFLEQVEFEDNYNVSISGRIWQKYPLDIVESVSIGIRLPQLSPFAESAMIEETYRRTIKKKEGQTGYLLVGYDLRSTLRLNLFYGEFPFDHREFDIRIEPRDETGNILLVPDLKSYKFTIPSQKCGLSEHVSIPGSEVQRTYFTFSREQKNSNFGFGSGLPVAQQATLHYRVELRRALLNAFVTYLIPIAITLIMIFLLMHACRKTAERQGIIESMAAFCFVLIFSHIDLRREIVSSELVYIEYFYVATYAMIMLSTFNLITYTMDKSPVFDFNQNQLFRAAYFPLFFAAILVVSLWKLY